MTYSYIFSAIAAMALVTYLIRMLPMVIFRKKIKNKWVQSFLYYVPYVVLAAMTFPGVFTSTGSVWGAVLGCAAAIILAYFKNGLLTVAIGAAGVAFVIQLMGV